MHTLGSLIRQLQANQQRLGIALKPPATEAEILRLEQALGRALPPDIAAFYGFCNGFETEDDMFRLVPIADAIGYSSGPVADAQGGTTTMLAQGRFVVAEFMIRSDLWEVTLDSWDGNYRVVNTAYGLDVAVTLTTSLYHFISRYLDGETLYDLHNWYQEEKQKIMPPDAR